MFFKRSSEMTNIISTINEEKFIEILKCCLIPSVINWFDVDDIVSRSVMHRVTEEIGTNAFLLKSHIKPRTWPENNPDLNQRINS